MRFLTALLLVLAASAQDAQPPVTPPVDPAAAPAAGPLSAQPADTPAPPPGPPVINVSIAPLAPPDLDSPYASPRDAARHRFQATLAALRVNHDLKDAIRGFEQAYLEDSTYAAAAFNLAILAAIDEKWDDAAAALSRAAELDPRGLGATSAPQLERLKLIASLEKSADGRRKRRYDEALLPLLDRLPLLAPDAANAALGDLGRIDPKRWESPALLAGLNGDGRGYEASAKFLEIAATNATDPAVKTALNAAHKAADREVQYASTRASAEAASDRGDYAKAAELYQSAWTLIPARMENGLDAASALLLSGDTTHTCELLARLRESGDPTASGLAEAMLKQLEPIEPAAKSATSDAAQFFRDRGSRDPVKIAVLIPAVDRKPLEIYTRPLPKLAEDPGSVTVLASLAADSPVKNAPLPALAPPSVTGDSPWQEVALVKARAAAPAAAPAPRPVQAVDLSGADAAVASRLLQVTSQPSGARLFIVPPAASPTVADTATPISDAATPAPPPPPQPLQPACETPCNVRLPEGEQTLRLTLANYQDAQQTVQLNIDNQELMVPLSQLRGSVMVESAAPADILVNGMPAGSQSPAELSLAPGLYRIGVNSSGKIEERLLNVKPGARLKLDFRP